MGENVTAYRLEEIALKINAEIRGDPDCLIECAEPLVSAGPSAITFLGNAKYHHLLAATKAAAVILSAQDAAECPTNALISANPELSFTQVLNLLYPAKQVAPGIHASVVIEANCKIDASVTIGPHCVIEEGVTIGANTLIEAGVFIGRNSQIGADCHLYSRVTIYHQVVLGDRVIIHSGAVLGADGFGLAHDGQQWIKIPQIGGVAIGNDVEIGANTTIDRGALKPTVIGHGVKIDNLVQIAHNVKIGSHTAIAGCTAIAGSTEVGSYCMIGGAVCINGHIKIADGVMLTGSSAVAHSIEAPGVYSSGVAVQKNSEWRRNMIRFQQLDQMAKRLRRLERKMEVTDDSTEIH
ncbi:MAG: UDP-3-O-(3-hydroxymyristoyl)glucosamine N-acyltransferase [Proteobacteria bacterium]|nr:UDP-3-O-(3-hydroxymyristoyl)glucosamine N-acyltransferase [Pseudomonadota bacterium]